jgi:hypothetical protein
MTEWTAEWPTESGRYWFYGWRFMPAYDRSPELSLVEIWKSPSGGLLYVTGGHFLYKEEGARGVWQKAILPELPPESLLADAD